MNRVRHLADEAVFYYEKIRRLDPQLSRGEIRQILQEIRSEFLPQIRSGMNPRKAGTKVTSSIQSVKEVAGSRLFPVIKLLEQFVGALVGLFESVIS